MKLDNAAIQAAARLHPHWHGTGTLGDESALRNTEEIVRSYLRAVKAASGTGPADK